MAHRWLAALGLGSGHDAPPNAVRQAALRTRELWLRARRKWTPSEKWNAAYAHGRWEYLARLDELARYSVLAGYAQWLKPGGSLLDVGCGEGLLRRRLHPTAFGQYTGIDFAEAVARAAHLRDERTEFVVADMTEYAPRHRFDVIALNEVLMYFPDPVLGLARYASQLQPAGVLLVSTFMSPAVEEVWARVGETYIVLDEVLITNRAGTTWLCKAMSMPGGAAS